MSITDNNNHDKAGSNKFGKKLVLDANSLKSLQPNKGNGLTEQERAMRATAINITRDNILTVKEVKELYNTQKISESTASKAIPTQDPEISPTIPSPLTNEKQHISPPSDSLTIEIKPDEQASEKPSKVDNKSNPDFMLSGKMQSILSRSSNKKNKKVKKISKNIANVNTRGPIVAVIGHIDHGKTTLIDHIRNSNLASKEVGAITQDIGAYYVNTSQGNLALLDTPGHAVFENIRTTGTLIADIVILLISAVEGIKEQTIQAIRECKQHKTPVIVAISKIDLPGANPQDIEHKLIQYDILTESVGGNTICCHTSGTTGEGINSLLENTVLLFNMLDIKHSPQPEGFIINATLSKSYGRCISVILTSQSAKKGQYIVFKNSFAKIRFIRNSSNKTVPYVPLTEPVLITGLKELPNSGEKFTVVDTEQEALKILESKAKAQPKKTVFTKNNVSKMLDSMNKTRLLFYIKASSDSTLLAIQNVILGIKSNSVEIEIIAKGIGDVVESDFDYFNSKNHLFVIAFGVGIDSNISNPSYVDIIISSNLIQDMEEKISKIIKQYQAKEKKVLGSAEVMEIFSMKKIGYVCGCKVVSGSLLVNHKARVIRNNQEIFDSKIVSLKLFKADISEQSAGKECGVILENVINNVVPGDLLECYTEI